MCSLGVKSMCKHHDGDKRAVAWKPFPLFNLQCAHDLHVQENTVDDNLSTVHARACMLRAAFIHACHAPIPVPSMCSHIMNKIEFLKNIQYFQNKEKGRYLYEKKIFFIGIELLIILNIKDQYHIYIYKTRYSYLFFLSFSNFYY